MFWDAIFVLVAMATLITGLRVPCTDRLSNCLDYKPERCRPPHVQWAKENCPVRCGLCPGGTIEINLNNFDPSVRDPILCVAEIDLECNTNNNVITYPDHSDVKYPYSDNAQRNSCNDRLSDCSMYDVQNCRPPNLYWAKNNCARRCGLCNTVVNRGGRGCSINGVVLSYGHTWTEQGKYRCQCNQNGGIQCDFPRDSENPKKSCTSSCVRWTVVTGHVSHVVTNQVHPHVHCHDTNRFCTTWAHQGECYKNPKYMLVRCPQSCRSC